VTLRQINRWRAKWQLSVARAAPLGRRQTAPCAWQCRGLCYSSSVLCGGASVACWLDQQEVFEPVVAGLKEAISAHQRIHPGEDFALLHHRDDPSASFSSPGSGPLLGIERLSGFDTHEHPA